MLSSSEFRAFSGIQAQPARRMPRMQANASMSLWLSTATDPLGPDAVGDQPVGESVREFAGGSEGQVAIAVDQAGAVRVAADAAVEVVDQSHDCISSCVRLMALMGRQTASFCSMAARLARNSAVVPLQATGRGR